MSKISGHENWDMRYLADYLGAANLSHGDLIGALILICKKMDDMDKDIHRAANTASMLANGVKPD